MYRFGLFLIAAVFLVSACGEDKKPSVQDDIARVLALSTASVSRTPDSIRGIWQRPIVAGESLVGLRSMRVSEDSVDLVLDCGRGIENMLDLHLDIRPITAEKVGYFVVLSRAYNHNSVCELEVPAGTIIAYNVDGLDSVVQIPSKGSLLKKVSDLLE